MRIFVDLLLGDTEPLPDEENDTEKRQSRILKLKLGMKTRTTLYKADDMKKIYTSKEDRKKEAIEKKAEVSREMLKKQLQGKVIEKPGPAEIEKYKSARIHKIPKKIVPVVEEASGTPGRFHPKVRFGEEMLLPLIKHLVNFILMIKTN